MNALALRDQLFSALHAAVLKPFGYKKRGQWMTRDCGDLVHSFHLRSSRFGDQAKAVFWIDVQIFSAEWHRLVFPELLYKGPAEGPSLVCRDLSGWCEPPLRSLQASLASDSALLLASLSEASKRHALPFLEQRQTPAALLDRLLAEREPDTELIVASLSRLLGYEAQAREYMDLAKRKAVHDNECRFLELRERNIWRDALQPAVGAAGTSAD